jgi:hypothetical protein
MRENFGISLRSELMAATLELLPERSCVLDDPIVDDGDVIRAVDVRVRVAFVRCAMGRPARMRDSGGTVHRGSRKGLFEVRYLAGCLSGLESASIGYRHTRGVVAPILETF